MLGRYVYYSCPPPLSATKTLCEINFQKPRMEHSFPLFKNMNVLPVRHLYVFTVLRIYFNTCHQYKYTSSYNTRQINQFMVPQPHKENFCHFYLFTAPTIMNKLPDEIKNCTDRNKFSKLLKNYLLSATCNVEELLKPQLRV